MPNMAEDVSVQTAAVAFVHIGYQRTATSYLQLKLFPLIHKPRLIELSPTVDRLADSLKLDRRRGFKAYFDDEFVLFSCEEIAATAERDRPENVEIIKASLPDARIVISIRSQYRILRGLYFLYLKGGGPQDFQQFVEERAGRLARFLQMVEAYRCAFGEDRVYVLLHEDLVSRPVETMRDLLSFMGCDPGLVEAVSPDEIKPTAPDVTLRILCARNRMFRTVGGLLPSAISGKLRQGGVPGSRMLAFLFGRWGLGALPYDKMRPVIQAAYAEDNAALFEILGKDITAYDYPQPGRR